VNWVHIGYFIRLDVNLLLMQIYGCTADITKYRPRVTNCFSLYLVKIIKISLIVMAPICLCLFARCISFNRYISI
jgi:hypothetical protein